ncbi:MAG TPA: Rrf2 family transcriptional regulator [Actinomycetota bacterium]|jgi:Rrf2 family protein|nr:Rrf2 family transcriptional regulator [Actinomycetota bacterium]
MLKVSQKTEYAMRAMLELALRRQADGDALVPARALAETQRIPLRFLEQQLGALHKAGLIESFRGAGGGCRLARPPSEIRVSEVVDAIEGHHHPMSCLDIEDHTCFADSHCGLQELWGEVDVAVRRVFETTTLADMAERHRRRIQRVWSPAELIRPHS